MHRNRVRFEPLAENVMEIFLFPLAYEHGRADPCDLHTRFSITRRVTFIVS